jgi:homoserine O-succinyltransferase/O-acetyltransferase
MTLVIGLVNNMPDAALPATERQFRELLAAAAGDIPVHLRLFALPDLPRSPAGRAHVERHYDDIGELWGSRLDGLFVTGTEPRAASLADEPYWDSLTRLVDWADGHVGSAIWSCLAAHLTVRHLDGIARRPMSRKLVGLFECAQAGEHEILSGVPARWHVPHSRHNGLPAAALRSCGYRLLSWSEAAGADMFAAERDSLFLFLQGHPEYDPLALYREYRRDAARFFAGERQTYPEMPRGYFDADAETAFAAFRERAVTARDPGLLAAFPAIAEATLRHSWREPALRLYANWLAYLARHQVIGKRTAPALEAVRPG